MPFLPGTFDATISLAVLEHVHDLHTYVYDTLRVLKPGGIAYFRWGPMWYSAHGHHAALIQPRFFPEGQTINDVIGDFNHLLMTPSELSEHMRSIMVFDEDRDGINVDKQLAILMDYIYDKPDLYDSTTTSTAHPATATNRIAISIATNYH